MTLPDKLTAAEFERLKAQEQRMLNSGSWVPQAEDRLTAQVNAAASDSAAPDSMTAEQADVAEAQQSVMAETQFGRSVGIRPDYSQPPAKDPAEDEPKTIGELRKRQQDLYNDPTYDMPFDEWQDFTRWKNQNESEVGSFIGGIPGMAESLGQLGVGLVKERAQQLYRATAGLDPVGAATTEVATFKEMGRKLGVGLTQLSDWVSGKIGDMVESGRRVGQVQQNVIQALRDNGQLTGDPIRDNTTIQKALEEAAAQGMYEPTEQQAAEDDETGYQRYLRKKSFDRDYSGITEFSIGGNRMTLPDVKKTATNPVTGQVEQPQEATSTVGAMAFSPENFIPVGVGVLAKARMLRRLASITGTPLKATETAMASLDDAIMRFSDKATSKIPIVGDLPLRQRAYTLAAVGGAGAYLDTATDSPIVDVIAKPLIFAGAVLPTAKFFGGTLRRVGAGAGAGWQVVREMDAGAVGSARAETAARMAASGKFNPRYSKYMERGAEGGVESTLRRVSQNPDMPETLRRVARSADNIGITQLARGIDDAVSSSVAAGVAATPFALVAPDSETAGGIVGGALLLGGTLGTAGRVIGRRSARTDADIARMMVDVEMAGGDAGSLGALSYSGLDLLSAMQGITSGKVDFVPLRAQEYRANADVRASGGETVAGLHIEQAADGRAKVYVNMGHTAPIAGRVSVKPIQITRNGKTEDANVIRIKGQDGQSDFTVVPKEYPLLVKSGDVVEPNARLARGLSPTHVMPHEIGHAILTSGILNGTIRDDLRNLVNQRYDTAGVEARGREYVTRIVDKDILAGAHDQLPDKLTQQEFDDIANGRRTMADVLKGKPVSDAQRETMINDRYNEMRERSIADGNNPDGLDVFRDEIVAETFSSLSDGIDFRRMRTGGPQVMESVLAATTRVFETLGMAFDRSTGKPLDNPSVVFRDNPLMKDPIMRKRMQEHLRNYEAWMVGMEQAGAREQKGTQVSVDGTAESVRRSTHTKLRANDNGVLENDLIYIDQNGQAQWKSQGMLDQQERGRSAQVGQLYDKNKVLPPNSAEFGLRRAGVGRTVISGPTLPAKFDVLRWFPKHLREMARMLEASRERGASHIFDYNTIGSGEGGRYRVINRGDVRAILREAAFLGWEATKNGHLKAVVMDLNAFRSAAMRAINRGELGVFNNDMTQLQADLMVYLSNHKNGLPGEATIGQQKRDMLNGLIGTGTAVQRDINPLYADLNPRGSVRSFRFDRINDITPTGRDGYHFDYDKIKNNRMPQALPREAMGMPEVAPSGRGQAMPDITITPDEARRRGLVGPVYHGSPDFKGRKFDPKYRARSSGISRGGFSFSDDVASADSYAAAPIDSAQAAVDSANDVMREAAGRMERGLKIKGFSAPDELPEFNVRYVDDISELSSYFNELAKDMPGDLADRLRDAAKQVNEPANPVVVEAYLRNPKTMDIDGKKLWLVDNPDDIFVSAARPPQGAATGRTRGQAMPDVAPTLENFDAAQQATGGTLRPIADQPENAPIAGRLTPEQSSSIDELQEYYRKVTPQRIKELQADAIESLASRLINKGISVTEANDMAKATFRTLRSRVNGAMQVISGMGTSDLSRMAGTGRPAVATRKGVNPNWLTSAFEAFDTDNDLALMKAQQVARQLNKEQQAQVAAGQSVDAARASGVRSATIDQGMQFVIGEKTADQKAFGSSLREDPSAPPRVYASVVEGQKFGSQGNYNVFFEWKKDAPMVITSHHHYGVGNGLTDIHASANIGDKNARSFGDPQAEVYDTLPSGKKVLRTRLLVGNAGAADIRAHQLMVSIPESALSGIKKKGAAGARAELNRIAISQLVGSASQGKTQSFTSKDGVAPMVAIQRNRTEAYVLNPDLKNVASITIVSNSPKETALIKKNLANAFKNNGSPLPRIKVVSAESGPSGNPGRKKITDEFFNLTGKVVYGAALGGAAALAAEESQQ